nr:MAG TPA: hypothetical protein [Caudoviricetes sp.]
MLRGNSVVCFAGKYAVIKGYWTFKGSDYSGPFYFRIGVVSYCGETCLVPRLWI